MTSKQLSYLNRMTEAQFQAAVLDLAMFTHWEFRYHNPDSRRSQAGFPDLVLGSKSQRRVIFRELKTETGRVQPKQVGVIDLMRLAGLDVGVWRPRDLVSGLIARELQGGAR